MALIAVFEKKTFEEAKEFCEEENGSLFSALNGTWEQLHILLEIAGWRHWIGVQRQSETLVEKSGWG